jgi:hypothetical protein
MTPAGLPPWPTAPVTHGPVVLRQFTVRDVPMAGYIEPWNAGSIGTAERAGYEREGLLRSHQEIGGRRRDMLLYASVRPDHG